MDRAIERSRSFKLASLSELRDDVLMVDSPSQDEIEEVGEADDEVGREPGRYDFAPSKEHTLLSELSVRCPGLSVRCTGSTPRILYCEPTNGT